MTKTQQRVINDARFAASMGNAAMAARLLSAAIRGSMRDSDKRELHVEAIQLRVDSNPYFVI